MACRLLPVLTLLLLALSQELTAKALTVALDPGELGEQREFFRFDLTEHFQSAGVVADGSVLPFEFRFADQKYLETVLYDSLGSSRDMTVILWLDWESGVQRANYSEPLTEPFFLFGKEATPGLDVVIHGMNQPDDGIGSQWRTNWGGHPRPLEVAIAGMKKSISLPLGIAGTPTIQQALLAFANGGFTPLTVRRIPEPSSATLLLAVLLGLSAMKRF